MIEETCANCGKIVNKWPCKKKNNVTKCVFCSKECWYNYSKKYFKDRNIKIRGVKEKKYCLVCGRELKTGKKYCSQRCKSEFEYNIYISEWLLGKRDGMKGKGSISKYIRKYLFRINKNKCQKCGWSETNDYSGNVPLEAHHKDGNCRNNKIENLELLCPNCHSLTRLYRALNYGKSKRYKKNNNCSRTK